ncbi:MAG: type IV pilin N-terminal domain-containing protein [Methanoregula sp.]|jgi:FlaG/FlaF family flagellin (archaellin)
MRYSTENAVSPVVGVMLMLVVTIIIAAVVSAFAGGFVATQSKPYQATIQGTYSISQGMTITHAGGDTLPTSQLVFTIYDGPTFGPGLKEQTTQTLDLKNITDAKGNPVQWSDGGYNITSFKSGDSLYINGSQTTCNVFQPINMPSPWALQSGSTYAYTGFKQAFWRLCIRNDDNVGKTFTLVVSDTKGNMISSSDVTITS